MDINYQALKPGEIRLLKMDEDLQKFDLSTIWPEYSSSPDRERYRYVPSATLRTVHLTATLQYHAISYMWGDASQQDPVLVDGQPVMVTRNLAWALEDVVDNMAPELPYTPTRSSILEMWPVWADALCINQQDDVEKSLQVNRMGEIYALAARVLVFADQRSKPAEVHQAQRILRICAGIHQNPRWQQLFSASEEGAPVSREWYRIYQALIKPLMALSSDDVTCLEKYTKRYGGWWDRAWVLQEVALANRKTMLLVSGGGNVSWDVLMAAIAYYNRDRTARRRIREERLEQGSAEVLPEVKKNLERVEKAFREVLTRLYQNRLMSTNVISKAKLPHDLVYSLLSMSDDAQSSGIVPEYEKTYQEVFRDVAVYLLRTKGAEMLQCARYDDRKADFPYSWIPDYPERMVTTPFQYWTEPGEDRMYNASADRSVWYYEVNRFELKLRGYLVGRVENIAGLWEPFSQGWMRSANDIEERHEWLLAFNKFVRAQTSLSAAQREESWRVPINDIDGSANNDRVGDEIRRGYEDLCLSATERPETTEEMIIYGYSLNQIAANGQRPMDIFTTDTGYLCHGQSDVEAGDPIYVITGADIPLALRRTDDGKFRIIGEVYVGCIMDGEFVRGQHPIAEDLVIT